MKYRFTHGYDEDRHTGVLIGMLWTDDLHGKPDGDVTMVPFFDEFDKWGKIELLSNVIFLLNREMEILIEQDMDEGGEK
jgi:hypothetical protein